MDPITKLIDSYLFYLNSKLYTFRISAASDSIDIELFGISTNFEIIQNSQIATFYSTTKSSGLTIKYQKIPNRFDIKIDTFKLAFPVFPQIQNSIKSLILDLSLHSDLISIQLKSLSIHFNKFLFTIMTLTHSFSLFKFSTPRYPQIVFKTYVNKELIIESQPVFINTKLLQRRINLNKTTALIPFFEQFIESLEFNFFFFKAVEKLSNVFQVFFDLENFKCAGFLFIANSVLEIRVVYMKSYILNFRILFGYNSFEVSDL